MVTVSPLSEESRSILAALTDKLSAGDEALRLLEFVDAMRGTRVEIEQGESFSDALRRAYAQAHPAPPLPPVPPSAPGTKDMLGSGG